MSNYASQRLQQYRATRQLDLEGLAKVVGVPRPTLTGWLYNGKVPRNSKVAELDRRGIVAAADWYRPAEPAERSGAVA